MISEEEIREWELYLLDKDKQRDERVKCELLDKVEKVVKNRINAYNPSYTDIYNVITELYEVVLNTIAEMKAEIEE